MQSFNSNFFEVICGYTEESLNRSSEQVHREVFIHKGDSVFPGLESSVAPILEIPSKPLQRSFSAGALHILSLAELKKAAEKVSAEQEATVPVSCPNIIVDFCSFFEGKELVDVTQIQSNPDNSGCLFQVASNFNAVESISHSVPPNAPSFTENYVNDLTQGPAASIGAAPAAIARVHAAFYDDNTPSTEWRQTADHQIELLGDVREYFPVVNGYVLGLDSAKPLPVDAEEREKLMGRVKVAVHRDVDAPVCRYHCNETEVRSEVSRVSQLFCAGVNIGLGRTGAANRSVRDVREKELFILAANYLATYYAAAALGCRKVYLTLVGGGAFGNKKEDIAEAIVRAHEDFCQHNFHVPLQEVHISLFSGNTQGIRGVVAGHRKGSYNYIEFDCSLKRETFNLDVILSLAHNQRLASMGKTQVGANVET